MASLVLHFNANPADVLRVCPSDARALLDSKVLANWKEHQEARVKIDVAVIDRLNTVIRALGMVAKTIARKG